LRGIALTAFLSAVLPCYSDKAGCGLGEAYRLFFVPVEVLVGMIVFSLSAFGKNRERPVKLTMLTLVMAMALLMLFAWGSDITSGNFSLKGVVETVEVLAVVIAVIIVQWLVIRAHLRRVQKQ
jgi:peptidoglycan/LPS O-acetylase OafA/YrhL